MRYSHYYTTDVWACARSPEATPALKRLLQDEAPPDDRNDFGETALHMAAARGNDEAVKLLLHHGADLLAADWESGWTPLHRSIYHQHLSTSLLLLRHAQAHFGKKFMRKYLHETRDHAQQSPMQLLSSTRPPHHRGSSGTAENSAEATDGGLVYTFGKRDYQLGYHLPNADMQVSPRLVELPVTSPVVQISASKYHTIALNAMGECFVWGFGKGGRLGTGSEFDRIEPTRLASLEMTPMQKVAAGENHTLALSRTGQVFSWGSNSFGQLGHPGKSSSSQSRLTPKRVDAFRLHVIADIAASGCHSAAITAEDGAVFTWGSNRRGQLGRKEGCGTDQADATPRSVDALRPRHPLGVVYGEYGSVRATQLALSDWNTCVVLRCAQNGRSLGQVWQFGYGSYRPSRVNFPLDTISTKVGAVMCDTWVPTCKQRGVDIVQVSCAQNHSIALTASGSVFTWGHNVPALSHQSSGDVHRNIVTSNISIPQSPSAPQCVPLNSYGPVASVCASQDHCAVVTQCGDLVTWGCGQQGVLGHGRGNTWQPSPKRVAGVKKAVAVAAGHQHTAILVAPVYPGFMSDEPNVVPSLLELVEREIAAHVDIANCTAVWQFAEHYAAVRLLTYCLDYMRSNWDAVLEVVGRDRMDTLFEIMLPPMDELDQEDKTHAIVFSQAEKPHKEKNIGKQTLTTKCTSKSGTGSATGAALERECLAGGNALTESRGKTRVEKEKPTEPADTPRKSRGRRKPKKTKFVSLTSFLSSKSSEIRVHGSSSQWGLLSSSTTADEKLAPKSMSISPPVLGPVPTASVPEVFRPATSLRKGSLDDTCQRQRKTSVGSHPSRSPRFSFSPLPTTGKHMLGYDGVEHEQVAAFSLDAFIKQPARRGARGKKVVPPAPTWSSPAIDATAGLEQKHTPQTLKEIQEEEKAAAAREREAKAQLSGGIAPSQRPQSTVNSWGLFRTPEHISFADVQKLQEEHEFLEQQRQILAEIEREQAEKARMAGTVAAESTSDRSKKSKTKDQKQTLSGSKHGRRTPNVNPSGSPAALGNGRQETQNKQKNAKERKAARKAAGETFNGHPVSGSAAATTGNKKSTQSPTNLSGNALAACTGKEEKQPKPKAFPKPKRRTPRSKGVQTIDAVKDAA